MNFAKTGDPNGAGLPAWPAFTDANQQVMKLDDPSKSIPVPNLEKLRCSMATSPGAAPRKRGSNDGHSERGDWTSHGQPRRPVDAVRQTARLGVPMASSTRHTGTASSPCPAPPANPRSSVTSSAASVASSCSGLLAPMIGLVIGGIRQHPRDRKRRQRNSRSRRDALQVADGLEDFLLPVAVPIKLSDAAAVREAGSLARRLREIVLAGKHSSCDRVDRGSRPRPPPRTEAAARARSRDKAGCSAAAPKRSAPIRAHRCGPAHAPPDTPR